MSRTSLSPTPQLIVFDLDLTLWHCGPLLWCDQLTPPLMKDAHGRVFDANGIEVKLYEETQDVLETLTESGLRLAVASRTSSPSMARTLLDFFQIDHFFEHEEIYPSDKTKHFAALQRKTRIPYQDMVFFDDEPRNIKSVSKLGVMTFLVTTGISKQYAGQIGFTNT